MTAPRALATILCTIGLHRWRDSRVMPEQVCTRCGMRRHGSGK
jgi:hypothetical protein